MASRCCRVWVCELGNQARVTEAVAVSHVPDGRSLRHMQMFFEMCRARYRVGMFFFVVLCFAVL